VKKVKVTLHTLIFKVGATGMRDINKYCKLTLLRSWWLVLLV